MIKKFKIGILTLSLLLPSLTMASGADMRNAVDVKELFASKGYTQPVDLSQPVINQSYKEFVQFDIIPYTTVGYHRDIDYLERTIKVSAASGIDARIIKSLVSEHFRNSELKSARGQVKAKEFINNNLRTWLSLLTRYNGDYEKMLEAYKYGASNIDYLIYRFGDDWSKHLDDIDHANGAVYIKDEPDSYQSYTKQVLSFWED